MSLREALKQEIETELRAEFAQIVQDAVRKELDARSDKTPANPKPAPAKKTAAKPEKTDGDTVEF